ncbi:MAG: hypothetical protein WB870_12015 [Gallionellaceae bacterium]
MTEERTQNLIAECKRQEESCLYTSTIIFEWLKSLRCWRVIFVVVPIILGGLATWPLLTKQTGLEWLTGICALLAGLAPAVYKALDLDLSLDTLAKDAHQFKILQDRFRQAWSVTALANFDAFKTEFDALMERMDAARARSHTAPERFFKKAQKIISGGDYDFGVDMRKSTK